jgi:hypothetical protein
VYFPVPNESLFKQVDKWIKRILFLIGCLRPLFYEFSEFLTNERYIKYIMNFLVSHSEFLAEAKLARKKRKNPCWSGYRQVGLKTKNGRKVPNCVPISLSESQLDPSSRDYGRVVRKFSRGEHEEMSNYLKNLPQDLSERIEFGAEKILNRFGQLYVVNNHFFCSPLHGVFLTEDNSNLGWEGFLKRLGLFGAGWLQEYKILGEKKFQDTYFREKENLDEFLFLGSSILS